MKSHRNTRPPAMAVSRSKNTSTRTSPVPRSPLSSLLLTWVITIALGGLNAAVVKAQVANAQSTDATSDHNEAGTAGQGDGGSLYASTIDPVISRYCLACHGPGLAAEQAGAALVLGASSLERQKALDAFVTQDGDSAEWLLAKVMGDADHGGGQVLAEGSAGFLALQGYFAEIGVVGDVDQPVSNTSFWQGTQLEGRRQTLRRAGLLLAGIVPSQAALDHAVESETALREELLALMEDDGFKQFLMTGANDRLLVSGLMAGVDFGFEIHHRYPEGFALMREFPEEPPPAFAGYHEKPFMTAHEAGYAMRWGMVRAPLELIAHVAMNNLSYQEILTAPYTMVNKFTEVAYRNDEINFPEPFTDEQGFWDRSSANTFAPGTDRGQVLEDDKYWYDWESGTFIDFGDYVERPHAGILSMPAWLARYPSTDTNRNRARARWTYYHFLGVDIEKSAPRSTDPNALADTHNPTLKNAACTVCHERLDKVAGAYQLFGDAGNFKDQYGGMDSLAALYKYPEHFGGQPNSSLYRHGDTWYRDMRAPGFESKRPRRDEDTLQWLAHTIAEDPRFATATVRFWWPAVFGAEVLTAPADVDHPNYDADIRAYNAQNFLIHKLADAFVGSGYQLKSLLADMVMSRWYRTGIVTEELPPQRALELATVGSGRLLTPEELDRKNRAVFGRSWGERSDQNPQDFASTSYLTSPHSHESLNTLYGGIDGASMLVRNRDFTSLMSNVAQRMALEMACQVVLDEFEKPAGERRVFTHVERGDVVGLVGATQFDLMGKVSGGKPDWVDHTRTLDVVHPGGRLALRLADMTPASYERFDETMPTNADLILRGVSIYRNGQLEQRTSGVDIRDAPDFDADTYTDADGILRLRGDVRHDVPGFWLHENAWLTFSVDLAPGNYRIEWSLSTSLHENAVPDSITANVGAYALDRSHQSSGSQRLRTQIAELLLRATNRPAQAPQIDAMLKMISDYAVAQRQEGSWYFSETAHCDMWMMGWRDLSDEEWARRAEDPTGMMRGWTLALEAILFSPQYLHD